MSRQLLEYHPAFGSRFIPGLKARVPHESGGYLVRVNNSGFRCEHEFVPARSGPRRALLFGGSFSAGDGVANDRRFGDLLERRIPGLEIYNFALPGMGTDQHYLVYRECAGGIEHDLLIIAVLVENVRRVVARYRVYPDDEGREACYAKPYYERLDSGLVLHNVPPSKEPVPLSAVGAAEAAFVHRGGRFPGLRHTVTSYQPLPEYDDPQHPAWLLMRAILERWIRGHAVPVLLVPLPLHQHVEETADPSGYAARFAELAAAAGCKLHDPLPDLLRYSPAERRAFRFAKDVHLTPAGHAALAASLGPAVERALAAGAIRS